MRCHGLSRVVVLVLTGVCLAGVPAWAQTSEAWSDVGFVLEQPGARALGMGSAFSAVADDSSAAAVNPAGLTRIETTEFTLEYAWNDRDYQPFLNRDELTASASSLSFLSAVWAVSPRHRLALWYHESLKERRNFESPGFPNSIPVEELEGYIWKPYTSEGSMTLQSVGATWSIALSPKFSVGGSLIWNEMDLEYTNTRYFWTDNPYGEPPGTPQFGFAADAKDDAYSFNYGVLWRLSDKITVGFSGRTPPDLEIQEDEVIYIPGVEEKPVTYEYKPISYYNLGLVITPNPRTSIGFEARRVNFSNLTENLKASFSYSNIENEVIFERGDDVSQYVNAQDYTQYHFGIEHFTSESARVAVRFGYYYVPSRDYNVSAPDDDLVIRTSLGNTFISIESVEHYTFGLGVAIGERAAWDTAIDVGDRSQRLVTSLTFAL